MDLQLEPLPPPELLYHGTADRNVAAIASGGLLRMARHPVHLSADSATARQVGARHGRPLVLEIASGRMSRDGFLFWRSQNGVWLVDAVPPAYSSFPDRGWSGSGANGSA